MTSKRLYLILLSVITLVSGSLLPFSYFGNSYSESLFLALLSSLFILYLSRNTIFLKLNSFLYFVLISAFIILQSGFIFSSDLRTVLGLLGRTTLSFIPSLILTPQLFASCYAALAFYYSLFSLPIYIITVFLSFFQIRLYEFLPTFENDAGNQFASLFSVYFYKVGKLVTTGPILWDYRNSGLFWEAGAYACFLGFALFFFLNSSEDNPLSASRKYKCAFLVLSILSTLSTIAPLIILISFLPRICKKAFKLKYTILQFCGLILALLLFAGASFTLASKLSLSSNISTIDRSVGTQVDLALATENPLIGLGYEHYELSFRQQALSRGAIYPTSTNSFLGRAAIFGFPFAALTFLPVLFFVRKLGYDSATGISFLALYAILFSSQGLVNHPLFLAMSFLGI
jgi:hypothetical protein